jgi:hypothetical protein
MSETVEGGTAAHSYKARARHDGDMWAVTIEGLPPNLAGFTQGRTWREAQMMANDCVACLLDVPVESVHVELRIA